MLLETILKINSIFEQKSLNVFFTKTLLFIIVFFSLNFPLFAYASCCTCNHPQIKTGTICISQENNSCTNLGSVNDELKSATCKTENNNSTCRLVKDGGVCVNNPNTTATAFKLNDILPKAPESTEPPPSSESTEFKPTPFKLNIDIPGAKFSNPSLQQGMLSIPYLGQYIQAFYKLLIGISLIAAAIMIIYGGFRYVVSATASKIQSGKQIIIDALMGLAIVLGAYVILANINPNLTQLESLTLPFVEKVPWDEIVGSATERPSEALRSIGNPSDKQAIAQDIVRYAKEFQIDPCVLLAICNHESGFKWRYEAEFINRSQYDATAIGYCGTHVNFFLDNAGFSNKVVNLLRKKFPEFPAWTNGKRKMTKEERNERIDWVIAHPQVSSYVAAYVYYGELSNTNVNKNEIQTIARYGAGGGSMKRWINKTNCKVEPNIRIKNAVNQDRASVLAKSCVPYGVSIPGKTPNDCEKDSYICAELKAKKNKGSTLYGHCPSNPDQECVGMKTDEFAQYVLNKYNEMQARFPFCK